MNQVSVVLPAKNEAETIGLLLTKLFSVNEVAEVIVVDDGSIDSTATIAAQAGARVLSHPRSSGNGAAVKTGARAAGMDYIVFMDSDGQHRPEDIPALVRLATESGWDMVVGARGKHGQASTGRRIANDFYNKLGTYVTGHPIRDLTSGFRVVDRAKFLEFIDLLPNGFSYPTTVTMAFLRAGYQVTFAPVTVLKRDGESNIKPIRDGIRFLLIIFKIATLYSPLKIFLPLAVLHFVLGVVRYVYTYVEMGTFTNMSAILFVTSIQIFLVGLVSEQITALMYKRN